MKFVYQVSSLAVLLTVSATSANSVESYLDTTFKELEASMPGKFNLDARWRYEAFDLQNGVAANDREGNSLRVRYGYTTPNFSGLTTMVEGETLTRVGGEVNDIHPLDEAGDGTDLNQLWLQYQDVDYGRIKLGRQIYALDDHRFIGHVGWRQNIQTFDAITAEYTGIEQLKVKPFYLAEQHSVNGLHNELNAYGVNIAYTFSKEFTLTAFYYDIEGDDSMNADASNTSLGLRATGTLMFDELPVHYAASLADQSDSGPSSIDYDASYFAADVSTTIEAITLGAGFEILEPGFRTPLATVHKFNGFADALLPTAGFTNGLEDYYVYAGYTLPIANGIKVKAIYHWFDSESAGASGQNGGEEIDLVAAYKINKYASLLAKYGDYSSDGGVGNAGAVDKKMFTCELNLKY